MWKKMTVFLQAHYRGVMAVNLALLLFVGTAVFYGVNAVRDIQTLDEVIVKADLQPTKPGGNADDWFSDYTTEATEQPTASIEPTKPKNQTVMVELYDTMAEFLPEGSIPDKKTLKQRQTDAKAVSTYECYEVYEKHFLNDSLISNVYMTTTSVHYANLETDNPEAFCELSKGESSYYFRLIFDHFSCSDRRLRFFLPVSPYLPREQGKSAEHGNRQRGQGRQRLFGRGGGLAVLQGGAEYGGHFLL